MIKQFFERLTANIRLGARARQVKLFCLVVLGLNGLLQSWLAVSHFGVDEIGHYRDLNSKLRLVGEVVGEPDLRSDGQNLTVEVGKIFLPAGGILPKACQI